MKNIMKMLKEQREANQKCKKRDRGFRRILYPKTKADLLAGEKMNQLIDKARGIYEKSIKLSRVELALDTIEEDYVRTELDISINTGQDCATIEPEIAITQNSQESGLNTLANTTKRFENVGICATTEELKNTTFISTADKAVEYAKTENTITVASINEEFIKPAEAISLNLAPNKFDIAIATKDLLISEIQNTSEDFVIIENKIIPSPIFLIDKPIITLDNSFSNFTPPSREVSQLLLIIEQTRFLKCRYKSQINSEELSSPIEVLINKIQHSPVVNCGHLNAEKLNKISTLQASPPVVNSTNLSTTDPSLISKSQNFNNSPVVSFTHLNTVESSKDLKLHKFNNSPVVSFTHSNTAHPNKIPTLQTFNKSPPVVNFIKLVPSNVGQALKLHKFNNSPVVSHASSGSALVHKSGHCLPVVNSFSIYRIPPSYKLRIH